jgi:uncharacterized protein DUF3306
VSGEGEGFLSRWSRRKRAAAVAPPAASPAAPSPPEAAPAEATAVPDARPAFDPASLPPVESLTAESDFAAFLRDEVPAALRRAALRRAWTLDPTIRDFVGPADYAYDYNAPDGVPGFSLNLTGNLERLVAQAIGAAPPAEEPREEEAPSPVEVAAPSPEPAPLELPPQDAPVVDAVADEPAPEAPPARTALVVEAPPVRRRHGGALPS